MSFSYSGSTVIFINSTLYTKMTLSYKAFSAHFKCRDFQFEVGKTYEIEGEPVLCKRGFHSCQEPQNVLLYYTDIRTNRYALIENVEKIINFHCLK